MEERIWSVQDKEMDTSVKENVRSKKKNNIKQQQNKTQNNLGTKYSGKLGYYEKTKSTNKKNRGRKLHCSRGNNFQQNIEEKFPNPKKEMFIKV